MRFRPLACSLLCAFWMTLGLAPTASAAQQARRTLEARVVALDQPFLCNRLGTSMPQGMLFALERDVVPMDTPIRGGLDSRPLAPGPLRAGEVRLRTGKRARPIALRMNVGDHLRVTFTNLLSPAPPSNAAAIGPMTRSAGFHVQGLEWMKSADSDGNWVGANPAAGSGSMGSLAAPGETLVYDYYAKAEGVFMVYSQDDHTNGQLDSGLFGAVTVQPEGAEWYRSQVSARDLELASYDPADLPPDFRLRPLVGDSVVLAGQRYPLLEATRLDSAGQVVQTSQVIERAGRLALPSGHPLLDYAARFPAGHWRQGQPVLNMLLSTDGGHEIVHSDLTAIITGPKAGRFPLSDQRPSLAANPVYPGRRLPYREFVIHYHNVTASQPFEAYFDPATAGAFGPGEDAFGINYGIAGIGAEILANRLGVGPMGREDAVDLKFEEFFLSSWAVGDPAMIVDIPANTPNASVGNPEQGRRLDDEHLTDRGPSFSELGRRKATKAFFPDDPSNVYHAYMQDPVKFRILNTGSGIVHVHHVHAHQFLRSPSSDKSHYLDSQMINAGSTYTLDMVHGGSGNRNQTVGDSIFHCHLYPHFAAGMWALWRVHDVFESGTALDGEGRPLPGSRALPDGEIALGTPIPAVVPLPTLGMAPIPAPTRLVEGGRRAEVDQERLADGTLGHRNPGFPFFVPGIAGHRAPHPPMDFAWEEDADGDPVRHSSGPLAGSLKYLDGGLPRHVVTGGETVIESHTRWDFTKEFVLYDSEDKTDPDRKLIAGSLEAIGLPEEGTPIEQVAMATHAQRTHSTFLPDGRPGSFTLNGLPPVPGAPFADPAVDERGNSESKVRRYKGAVVQMDVVFNKQGWHFPQQRFITLWEDVKDTIAGLRPPQPFFFRAHSGETVEFWHTNLVPAYYEMDDFQVRTPTDIISQHIHLVKFDVTSSDGAANGFNYEDGTFSPDEVRSRIDAINAAGGLRGFDPSTGQASEERRLLTVHPYDRELLGEPPAGQNWDGAQTTIQRFDTDPLFDNEGVDRTLRTVFTHDHFGPSTHQQVGLYAGFLIEPEGSEWFDNETNAPMHTRPDGGPTSWQAKIVTAEEGDSYREFALAMQDFALAYQPGSRHEPAPPTSPLFHMAAGYAEALDRCEVPASVRTAFARAGATLRGEVTVTVQEPGRRWELLETGTRRSYAVAKRSLFHLDGSLAEALNEQRLPPALRAAFSTWGIELSVDATVRPDSPGWILSQPRGWQAPERRTQEDYALRPDGQRLAVERLAVQAPSGFHTWGDPAHAVNAIFDPANRANGGPYPGLVSSFPDAGTWSVNYRGEPLPFRVDPHPPGATELPASARREALDLAHAHRSIPRLDPKLNRQPTPGSPIDPFQPQGFRFPPDLVVTGEHGVRGTDPYTPMLRAYTGDRIQIRTLVGAHEQTHPFQVHGVRWLFEPSWPDSGYRNVQGMALSEHYEMEFRLPHARTSEQVPFADYWWSASSGVPGRTTGLWGLMRGFDPARGRVPELAVMPGNDPAEMGGAAPKSDFQRPAGAPVRRFHIVATTAQQALPDGQLVFNSRGQLISQTPLHFDEATLNNPYGVLYVRAEDLDASGKLKPNVPVEPLVLRVCAGDWIELTLENRIDPESRMASFRTVAEAPFGTTPAFVAAGQDLGSQANGPIPGDLRQSFAQAGLHLGEQAVCSPVSSGQWRIEDPSSQRSFNLRLDRDGLAVSPDYPLAASTDVGLHAQLLSYDITVGDGTNVGFNPITTLRPGQNKTVAWYAGTIEPNDRGELEATPVEFGAINLTPADGLLQSALGMVGALIVEPAGSTWQTDQHTRAAATVAAPGQKPFREAVILVQDDARIFRGKDPDGEPAPYLVTDGPTGVFIATGAINYRSEPSNYRFPAQVPLFEASGIATEDLDRGRMPGDLRAVFAAHGRALGFGTQVSTLVAGRHWQVNDTNAISGITSTTDLRLAGDRLVASLNLDPQDASGNQLPVPFDVLANRVDLSAWLANQGVAGDPQTPVVACEAGVPLRLRWLFSAGNGSEGQAIGIHGHSWQQEPFTEGSLRIGDNPKSEVLGQQRIVPYQPLNLVLDSAGGTFAVPGDYLFHHFNNNRVGLWGILRVTEPGQDAISLASATVRDGAITVSGQVTVHPATGRFADSVQVSLRGRIQGPDLQAAVPVDSRGHWQASLHCSAAQPGEEVQVTSSSGSQAQALLRAGQ